MQTVGRIVDGLTVCDQQIILTTLIQLKSSILGLGFELLVVVGIELPFTLVSTIIRDVPDIR